MAFHIVLYQPEIPSNTGNIARTCAATGTHLHLIHPLGFSTSDKYLKRAGLDYWNEVSIHHHDSFQHFLEEKEAGDMYFIETNGTAFYTEKMYKDGDYFVFGRETKGIAKEILDKYKPQIVRIPMRDGTRSLNLANTAAIVVYEALRQISFQRLV